MKTGLLIVSIALTGLSATAGINSGEPTGFLDRGEALYNIGFYDAAIDQLSFFNNISNPTEASCVTRALSAAKGAYPNALQLLHAVLDEYPATPARAYINFVIGNIYLDRATTDPDLWEEAYQSFNKIGDDAFDPELDAELKLRKAIAAIHTGRTHEAELLLSSIPASGPHGSDILFYQGYLAYSRGDYAKAGSILTQHPSRDNEPGDMKSIMTPFMLAQINYIEGNDDIALEYSRQLLDQPIPNDYDDIRCEVLRIAGEIKYRRGERDEALKLLRQYVDDNFISQSREAKDHPEAAGSFYILGINDYMMSLYPQARSYLRDACISSNDIAQSALLTIGQSHYNEGEKAAAAIPLDKAVALDADPKITEEALYDYIVVMLEGSGLPFSSTSRSCLDFLKRFPDSRHASQVAAYMADGYITDNNYAAALNSINLVKSPSNQLLKSKQYILYIMALKELDAGRYATALDYAGQGVKLKSLDSQIAAECELIEADCLYREGKYADAENKYADYLKKAPAGAKNIPLATYDLAYALFNRQQYAKARSRFENYLRQPGQTTPSMQADAANRLADCLYYQGKLDEAIPWYDKAAELNPEAADYALFQRAIVLGYQGKNNEKIETLLKLQHTYKNSPVLPDAMLELAIAYRQSRRDKDAINTFTAVEAQFPASPHARKALFMMSSMQAAGGDTDAAFSSFKKLISNHSPSPEAEAAAQSFKELAVQEGRFEEYVAFISSSTHAPKLDDNELDDLTYRSAKTARQLEDYLDKYPHGSHGAEAVVTLMRDASKRGDNVRALSFASRLVTDYSGSPLVAEGWLTKASIEMADGLLADALESFTQLENHAPDPQTISTARLGQLKSARLLNRHEDVIAIADKLLNSSSTGKADSKEIMFHKANALRELNRDKEAIDIWSELAKTPTEQIGAQSAYLLAEYYFLHGDNDMAWKAANALTESKTGQNYWLARGFILTSDLYRAQGDTFEADEYLKILKENYPGSEQDIFDMIEERLNK